MFKSKLLVLLNALAISGAALANVDTGLVAHWDFDDCTATDSSGNGHNGVIYGAPKCVTGIYGNGKALQFNGISDFIEVADAANLRLSGTSYTLSGWALLKKYNKSFQSTLIAKRESGSDKGYLWSLSGEKAGYPLGRQAMVVSGGDDPAIYSDKGNELNVWRHYVMVYNATTKKGQLYINNLPRGSAVNFPSPNPSTAVSLRIAKDSVASSSYGYYFLNGKLDDLRIYNRALTRDEITELYNFVQPVKGTATGLQQISVTCKNISTGQVVTIPFQSNRAWNCKKAGLRTKPNQSVNISIDGHTYP